MALGSEQVGGMLTSRQGGSQVDGEAAGKLGASKLDLGLGIAVAVWELGKGT